MQPGKRRHAGRVSAQTSRVRRATSPSQLTPYELERRANIERINASVEAREVAASISDINRATVSAVFRFKIK